MPLRGEFLRWGFPGYSLNGLWEADMSGSALLVPYQRIYTPAAAALEVLSPGVPPLRSRGGGIPPTAAAVQDGSSKNALKTNLLHINLKNPKVTRPGFHLDALNTRKVATQTISYKRYREILFQKVASGYLLHFVQDGSSKHVLDK